ncbi:hypothetical protein ANN_16519 [Periplaneta americana]|uniref:DUF4817 domain-containing protein n=1 Tax=Periplaneta americana TaxID=6978 RepID=A0ABQ8SRD4_PERAM|nr:hypothetical protein ANN_16519 [Periplaneta americana]
MNVQRKVQCVLWLAKFESVTRVRREFRRVFNKEPPHENNIRRWDRQLRGEDATQRAYQREFGVRNPPKRNTILGLVNKLETTGSLVSEKGKHRSSRLPTVVVDVRARLEQSPKKIIKTFVAGDRVHLLNVSESLKPYRVTVVHQLQEPDKDKRLNYCRWFQTFIVQNPAILSITWNLWPPRSPDLTTPDNICYRGISFAFMLTGNPWDCSKDLTWLVDDARNSSVASRVVDRDKMICNNETYPKKPVLPIMGMIKTLQDECPREPPTNCTCRMEYVAPHPDGVTLRPVTTVNCSYRGLQELPGKLPSVTTTLLLKGNQISSLKPLVSNPHYRGVLDLFLDDNRVQSLGVLEGADWLLGFRVLSLRGNRLAQVPTYALDNALQRNRHAAYLYLGTNPWLCDCLFTPSFQDFIIKYRKLVKDIDDVRCSSVDGDDNSYSQVGETTVTEHDNKNHLLENERHGHYEAVSLLQIQTLSRSSVCLEPSEYLVRPLDLINGILASLIVLVVGKLIYDYWSFKKTGKLPWIVAKMP